VSVAACAVYLYAIRLDSVACVVHPIVWRRRKRQGSHVCARERQRSRTLRLWLGMARPARSCRTRGVAVAAVARCTTACTSSDEPAHAHTILGATQRTRFACVHAIRHAVARGAHSPCSVRSGPSLPALYATSSAPLRCAVTAARRGAPKRCLPACPVRLSCPPVPSTSLSTMPAVDAWRRCRLVRGCCVRMRMVHHDNDTLRLPWRHANPLPFSA
jgi:hypothetical protein